MTGRSTCPEMAETRAELALGLLSGTDRAAAVAHLADCPRCRDEVDDIARVADQLLLLAPPVDPPPGFETRVLEAVASGRAAVPGGRRRSWTRRRRGRLVGGLAATLVATGLIGAGLFAAGLFGSLGVVRDGERPTVPAATPTVRTALAVSPSGRATCRVVVSGTRPATVLVSFDGSPGSAAEYDIAVRQASGPTISLGTLKLTDGHGTLARSVPVDAAALTTVLMHGNDGRLLYEAHLSQQVPAPEAPVVGR